MMKIYDEIYKAAKSVVKSKKNNEFSIGEIVNCLDENNTSYNRNSVRRCIGTTCCIDTPNHTYPYFKRNGDHFLRHSRPLLRSVRNYSTHEEIPAVPDSRMKLRVSNKPGAR